MGLLWAWLILRQWVIANCCVVLALQYIQRNLAHNWHFCLFAASVIGLDLPVDAESCLGLSLIDFGIAMAAGAAGAFA